MRRTFIAVIALAALAAAWVPAFAANTTRNCQWSYTNDANMNRVLDKLDTTLGLLYVSCTAGTTKFVTTTTSTSSSTTTSTSSTTTTST